MKKYALDEIASIIDGEMKGVPGNVNIQSISIDSRTISDSGHTLFFALKGKNHNGHEFIPELYETGQKYYVISEFLPSFSQCKDACFIQVKDTLVALQQFMTHHRKKFNYPVVGITGSNGKTLLKEWLFQLLHEDKRIIRSPKSYNSQVGVPLSVWLMDENYDMGIFEAGISQPGEMNLLKKMIEPDIGIITNIGEAHQEHFINLKEKVKEKLKLFPGIKTLIYCRDHDLIHEEILSNVLLEGTEKFRWSRKSDADLYIKSAEKTGNHSIITGKYKGDQIAIEIPFSDDASIENLIHAWAFMLYLGYNNELIRKRMLSLSPVAMRLELVKGVNNCTLINDTYNSDIGSLSIALDVLNQQNQHQTKTLILSDILQSGRDSENLYREVAVLLERKKISRFIGIGSEIKKNAQAFPKNSKFYDSTPGLLDHFSQKQFSDEAILIKGSRIFRFEKIVRALEQKIHRTVLEINLNALMENLNYYRQLLKPSTKIMAMVKASSYGSGSYEIANILQFHRVDYLAVAVADEGISLRKSGIHTPIMVLNPEITDFQQMIENRLEPEIYNIRILRSFIAVLDRTGVLEYPIHIKLDSGMHRLGFMPGDIDELIEILTKTHSIKVKSIFSHLAASEDPSEDTFSEEQVKKFSMLSEKIMSRLRYKADRHILNSGGIERFNHYQFDMVRLGIGIYGISSSGKYQLKNVTTLKSRISQIKVVPAGETIGYGRKGKSPKELKIGIIPIGYADGLNRKLGNGNGTLYINGSFATIIGNICMDMCMINLEGIAANEEDEVEIFGEHIPIEKLAEKLETIPYEILTSVSSRVKRIYYQE